MPYEPKYRVGGVPISTLVYGIKYQGIVNPNFASIKLNNGKTLLQHCQDNGLGLEGAWEVIVSVPVAIVTGPVEIDHRLRPRLGL
ncbi:MAG: hypothetical protein MjAS7_2353 [Metallosphaera javensis (ex Sakai et al. 2022)]|nr:MAG: hypothetical protein MjAS7_2353 [Metallosphaera javensis (ex Sakai et al. 2022)]